MKTIKWIYKIFRSIILSLILTVAVLLVFIYVALSIPPVQNLIRQRVQTELSTFLGSDLKVGSLTIYPLNELIIQDLILKDLNGEDCLEVKRLGAGINLWRLLFSGEIEITYAELLDFNACIYQAQEGDPLNIDFLIKAFAPQEKNKTPSKFDLKIHNIVIRNGDLRYSRLWKEKKEIGKFDANYISISNLSGDITLPRLSNDDIQIDLRRLSFNEQSGLQVKEIRGLFILRPDEITVSDFGVKLPETSINFNDTEAHLKNGHLTGTMELEITDSHITPSNLSAFFPPLSGMDFPIPLVARITLSQNEIEVDHLSLGDDNLGFSSYLVGKISQLSEKDSQLASLTTLNVKVKPGFMPRLLSLLPGTGASEPLQQIITNIGDIEFISSGRYDTKTDEINLDAALETAVGKLNLGFDGKIKEKNIDGVLNLSIPELELKPILPSLPLSSLANARVDLTGCLNLRQPLNSDAEVEFNIGEISLLNRVVTSIQGLATKTSQFYSLSLDVADDNLNGELEATANLAGIDSEWHLMANLNDFDTYNSLLEEDAAMGYEFKGKIEVDAQGNDIDNLRGQLLLTDFHVRNPKEKTIYVNDLSLSLKEEDEDSKYLKLSSEVIDISFEGNYIISQIPGMVRRTLGEVCPAIFNPYDGPADCGSGTFEVAIKDAEQIIEFFNLPIFPLTSLSIKGVIDSYADLIEFSTDIPYIQQGKNLITNTYLYVWASGSEGDAKITAGTVYPTKKGLLKLDIDVDGRSGLYDIRLDFNKGREVSFYGSVDIDVSLDKDPLTGHLGVLASFQPSTLHLNSAAWKLGEATILYNGDLLDIKDFSLRHDNQFVLIGGSSAKTGEGLVKVELADINVDYVFDTLNINHVTFGGTASGIVEASDIFCGNPNVQTRDFRIDDMSYNGAVLGNGDITAGLNLPEKMIAIAAQIREGKKLVADADGGVWFGRDSLAFNFKADSVNIAFMQPFMQAFSSEVKGRATGNALLAGTFSDIDMTGTIVAHNASILIDFINTRYTGSDTVYLHPGRIEIPHFMVADKAGHTALVEGVLTHRYFHEPAFRFNVKDMHNLLVYDTNAKNNPLWYGTIYTSGAGEITGRPGIVNIAADATTGPGSDFTFVLSDQQEAVKSHFLTFSDRRREAMEALQPKDTVPDFLQRFQKQQHHQEEESDIFTMDIRVSVNDDIRFNLIMDPVAGDKITAYGSGAMNMTYTSLTDELRLYGKYVLDKGTYNFSLQDIILKEFIIKPGSSIAFTGDPYTGVLDITAAYRVNTSLTELDRSFASDRELNRTSVPVEALLEVTGVLTSPTINFDIELPTVTEETAQKVRSIISTEDMMSRQVLYLVALNKFYSPEYMSTSNSGGEWASIASSTISSQIQNVIGQLTDKFTLAPSIRSDKGDFSDIEFDLALSSQLFNNRLLINGNLGYRDPSNSSTTFVGDFDLEYLLNRKGTWRLKAYNHFNDQNYYLKSALTTQGLGIVWRKDFGNPRNKIEAKKEEDEKKETTEETK